MRKFKNVMVVLAASALGLGVAAANADNTVMNSDQLHGKVRKEEGKLKAETGKATGDTKMRIKGDAQQAAGQVQESYGDAKAKIKQEMKK